MSLEADQYLQHAAHMLPHIMGIPFPCITGYQQAVVSYSSLVSAQKQDLGVLSDLGVCPLQAWFGHWLHCIAVLEHNKKAIGQLKHDVLSGELIYCLLSRSGCAHVFARGYLPAMQPTS